MIELFAKVNHLFAFSRVAVTAKWLKVLRVIGATYAEWNYVIHRWWTLFATGKATAVWGISMKNGNPFVAAAIAFGIAPASEIAMLCNAIRFGVPGAVSSDNRIAPLTIILAPFRRQLIKPLAILGRPCPLAITNLLLMRLAISVALFNLPFRILFDVLALIGGSALATLGLFTVWVSLVWREAVQGLGNLALGARLEDNRHRSISLLDWAVPRLLQQRVAFSCHSLYLWCGR